ncbi:ORF6C domain-containing protein [Anaeroselena agilis]|uniref:ORF6C domain-containing protein n=1 Tax=Anaeroselena agilis TaxID=3063788 RepID=A0ABU3NYJ8_9FIRM|nr:ORF6C domain-containing protein [Selenomonadales bacterium 4137-cl]
MSNLAIVGGRRELSPEETLQALQMMLSTVEGFAGKVVKLESKVATLEDKVETKLHIDYNQQRALQKAIGRRVREMLPSEKAYREHSKVYFAALYSALKDVYQVPSYRDIPLMMFDHAMKYVGDWEYLGAA